MRGDCRLDIDLVFPFLVVSPSTFRGKGEGGFKGGLDGRDGFLVV